MFRNISPEFSPNLLACQVRLFWFDTSVLLLYQLLTFSLTPYDPQRSVFPSTVCAFHLLVLLPGMTHHCIISARSLQPGPPRVFPMCSSLSHPELSLPCEHNSFPLISVPRAEHCSCLLKYLSHHFLKSLKICLVTLLVTEPIYSRFQINGWGMR